MGNIGKDYLWFSKYSCEKKYFYCNLSGTVEKQWNGQQYFWNAGSGNIKFELNKKGIPINISIFAISDTEFAIKSHLNHKVYTSEWSETGKIYEISYSENLFGRKSIEVQIICQHSVNCANIYSMEVLYDARTYENSSLIIAGLVMTIVLILFAKLLPVQRRSAGTPQ